MTPRFDPTTQTMTFSELLPLCSQAMGAMRMSRSRYRFIAVPALSLCAEKIFNKSLLYYFVILNHLLSQSYVL